MLTGDKRKIEQPIGGPVGGEFLSSPDELDAVAEEIVRFVRETVADAGAEGAIVAMSGGIDSTLTATLAAEALDGDRVLGLGLPCTKMDDRRVSDARTIADGLGIEFREIQLRPLLDAFEDVVAPTIDGGDETAAGNIVARLRMLAAYYAANAESRVVVGTSNRSELLLGYFTKYGDGAADLYPLGDLYKTEVRALAQHVGVPRRIVYKTPTAGLRAGQTDEGDLGASYPCIDRLLRRLVDHDESIDASAERVGVERATAKRIAELYATSVHKRTVPPTPGVAERGADRPPDPLRLAPRSDAETPD